MRITMIVLILGVINGCGVTNTDCSHGSITPGKTLAGVSELPSEFGYSATEFRNAIIGVWADTAKDVSLTLNPAPDTSIDYDISGVGTKCGPTQTRMSVQGELETSGAGPVPVSGMFYAGARLTNARLNITLGTQSCLFIYAIANETSGAKLKSDGFCNLSAARFWPKPGNFRTSGKLHQPAADKEHKFSIRKVIRAGFPSKRRQAQGQGLR